MVAFTAAVHSSIGNLVMRWPSSLKNVKRPRESHTDLSSFWSTSCMVMLWAVAAVWARAAKRMVKTFHILLQLLSDLYCLCLMMVSSLKYPVLLLMVCQLLCKKKRIA